MRKFLTALVTVFAVGLLSLPGARAQNIAGTPHDLSGIAGGGANSGEICVYCHTPHTDNTSTNPPLWNRNAPTGGTFTMYNSPSIDMVFNAAGPRGVSAGCLSCHDGVSAIEAVEDGDLGTIGTITNVNATATGTILGNDLRNDHPISVTYNNTLDTDFNNPPTNIENTPLFEDPDNAGTFNQVECASCHDPHNNANGTYLRIPNTASAICVSCHAK
jgi:predicted CXXCH cytochrome family protein